MSDKNTINLWQSGWIGDIKEGKYYIYKNPDSKVWGEYFICSEIDTDLRNKLYIMPHDSDIIEKTISSCGGEHKSIKCYPDKEIYYYSWYDLGYYILYYKNVYLTCKVNNECKEVFIHGCKDSILIYKLYYILDLKPNTNYIISNFTKSDYKSRDTITARQLNNYKNINKYYINKKVMSILEKYFICEEDNIYCVYNNKKVIATLVLMTKDVIETDDDQILHQSLLLIIGDKHFIFYINDSKNINYMKTGKYCFLAMHLYNNLIYGYEFKENKYYCLKDEEDLILKNIDKEIIKNLEEIKEQNLYTYLSSNNKKHGMTINIDKDGNITYRLLNLNDEFFKSKSMKILDISLLKPQIINEDCENK